MKSIIVYYSLEGNCKLIAEAMAAQIGADTLELKLKKPIPTSGPMKFILGGRSAVMKELPELVNAPADLSEYELVVVGSPVWAGTYAPAIRSFAKSAQLQNKKMAFFACCDGGQTEKCLNNMKSTFEGNDVLADISFVKTLKNATDCTNKAKSWIHTLV